MSDEATSPVGSGKKGGVRIDWRTGKPMVSHDDAFWQEHEQRRIEQGMSVSQYCAATGLALTTYRLRVGGKKRAQQSATPSFVAITKPAAPAETGTVEVVLQGMTMRLGGAAAERVLSRVLERLA
ncbi:IS66 family insertion sequence element accessory protein TnpA [Tepidimonas sp.]|uniref:IS66 family insertion sequence element accessory protein TnpA n=1 Tax=Tepidimonas sp. TaxID=2002775 RepID=UPI002FE2C948